MPSLELEFSGEKLWIDARIHLRHHGDEKASELISLCYPLALTHVAVQIRVDESDCRIVCQVTAETTGSTGVEMEALTALQIALLTIYDMCKAVDWGMVMGGVQLAGNGVETTGGFWFPSIAKSTPSPTNTCTSSYHFCSSHQFATLPPISKQQMHRW